MPIRDSHVRALIQASLNRASAAKLVGPEAAARAADHLASLAATATDEEIAAAHRHLGVD